MLGLGCMGGNLDLGTSCGVDGAIGEGIDLLSHSITR